MFDDFDTQIQPEEFYTEADYAEIEEDENDQRWIWYFTRCLKGIELYVRSIVVVLALASLVFMLPAAAIDLLTKDQEEQ